HATETGFGIRHDRQEIIDVAFVAGLQAFGPLNLVGAFERGIDALHDGGHRVHRIQRLVRVHGHAGVVVGGDLPAGQVDGLNAGLGLLHRLAAGEGAHAVHEVFVFAEGGVGAVVYQVPEFFRAAARQQVIGLDRAA